MVVNNQERNREVLNNLVAESDYQAAVEAISSTFDAFIFQTNQTTDGMGGTEDDTENKDDDRRMKNGQLLVQQIYETARQSMMTNLERIVRPITDSDYQNYVDQYHYVLDDDDDDQGRDGGEVDHDGYDESDHEEDDEEIDEEELLDIDALTSARSLREKLRTISGNIQSIRDRILQNVDHHIIVTSLSDYLVDQRVVVTEDGVVVGDDSDISPHGDSLDKENIDSHSNFNKGMVDNHSQALNDSLKTLSNILQAPQWASLPQRIQSLQDTIGAIQKGTQENRALSAVEVAIESRTNHTHDNTIQEASRKLLEEDATNAQFANDGSMESISTLSAVDRLALFGHFPF